jgi:hypothetical protein
MGRKRGKGQKTLCVADLLAAEAAKKAAAVVPEKREEKKPVRTPAVSAIPKKASAKKAQTAHSPEPIFSIEGVLVRIPPLTRHLFNTAHTFLNTNGRARPRTVRLSLFQLLDFVFF